MSIVKTAYLIDGSAYIYRAFHAIASLSNSSGLPTNAVYGFTQTLRRIIREREPAYIAVAFDTRGEVFRHRIYTDYKANRPPMPEELAQQIPYIRKVVAAYNLLQLEDGDQEADDLIASAATRLAAKGFQVVIVSGDKDLLQLVSGNVRMWDPMRDVTMDTEGVRQKYGLGPESLLDYFALTGDASDNIPGVPGIGPKTALKLISEHESLEGLYEAVDSLKKSKMKENLLNHRDDAFLSRDLIRLNMQAPVPDDPEMYRIKAPHQDALRDLFTELEFQRLLKEDAPAGKLDTKSFHLVQNTDELRELVRLLEKAELLVVDTETTSLDPLRAELVGISLGFDLENSWYLPCGHRDAAGNLLPDILQREELIAALRPFLENTSLPKVGHNLKYDYAILAANQNGGIILQGSLYDTMLGAWLLEPGRRSYKLDDLCREQGMELTSFAEVVAGEKEEDAFSRVGLTTACNYSCEDIHGSLALFLEQRPLLEKNDMWSLFADLEGPLIPVLAGMEQAGIALDAKELAALSREFGQSLQELEEEIYTLAAKKFNINSPQQLSEVLFDDLGLPRGRKTKTGYSTDVKVLEKLAHQHELPRLILQYRNLAKLKSTYVDKLSELIHPQTGRVHSSFNQCGTATGRLSSSNPNLQNIPIRTEEGRRIRACFIPKEGSVFLSGDYSQIDLRVLAHYSQDTALLNAFQKGEDIHTKTAAEIFFVAPELVTTDMRRVAKTINFGIVYGMSSFGLSNQMGISRKEAQTFIDRYFSHYDGVKQFMHDIVEQAKKDGFVSTMLGRRRPIPEINSSNRTRREFAERIAINTPVQGTAADIIKLAMLKVEEEIQKKTLMSRMVLQVHDELVLEVPENELQPVKKLVKKCMENVMKLDVPLVVNLAVGQNLGKS